jgi:hypothetical protein
LSAAGAVVFAVLMTTPLAAVIRNWWRSRSGDAAACTPLEALEALRWEIPGTLEGGRFECRFKDRALVVSVERGHYRIEVEGVPQAGDLEGKDAVSMLEEIARSGDRRLLDRFPDWQAILQVFRAHRLRFAEGRLEAMADFGGSVLGPSDEAARLKRLLERLIDATRIADLVLSLRTREAVHTRCPYCHEDFGSEGAEALVQCAKCGARHHAECFQEFGKCAVFACSARITEPLRDLAGPEKG